MHHKADWSDRVTACVGSHSYSHVGVFANHGASWGIHVRLVFTILLVAVFVLSSALVFWRESDGINWMITVVAIISFGALLGLATGKARE